LPAAYPAGFFLHVCKATIPIWKIAYLFLIFKVKVIYNRYLVIFNVFNKIGTPIAKYGYRGYPQIKMKGVVLWR
jgi:hypothetical protein